VDTTGLELGSCLGGGREVRVDDGAPSGEDPLQVARLVINFIIYSVGG